MKAIKAMQVKQRLPTWRAVRRYRCSMVQSAAFPIRWSAGSPGARCRAPKQGMEDRVRQREPQALQQREDQLANAAGQKKATQALHAVPALQRISIWRKWGASTIRSNMRRWCTGRIRANT